MKSDDGHMALGKHRLASSEVGGSAFPGTIMGVAGAYYDHFY